MAVLQAVSARLCTKKAAEYFHSRRRFKHIQILGQLTVVDGGGRCAEFVSHLVSLWRVAFQSAKLIISAFICKFFPSFRFPVFYLSAPIRPHGRFEPVGAREREQKKAAPTPPELPFSFISKH